MFNGLGVRVEVEYFEVLELESEVRTGVGVGSRRRVFSSFGTGVE